MSNERRKLVSLLESFERIHQQLLIALSEPRSPIVRDSALLRFELTYELFWKILQEYCKRKGIISNSPKDSIRDAFRLGVLDDNSIYIEMVETRNLLIHTYEEEIADTIYGSLRQYADAMEKGIEQVKKTSE